MNIVSIGEILWDVFPSSEERLGGAPFNFSANATRLGHHVRFVSGVGSDARGEKALEEMARLSTSSRYVRKVFDAPTGIVTVSFGKDGEPDYFLHRPAAYDFPALDDADLKEIREINPEWVYYGTLSEVSAVVHAAAEALLATAPHARRFYDVNLRKGSDDDPGLLDRLLRRATFAKLNESEAVRIANFFDLPPSPLDTFCEALRARYRLDGVCITLGAEGCALSADGKFARCPGYRIRVQDAVGAGDAFAAALVHGVGSGWTLGETGDFANRVGALVASRAGAIPDWSVAECLELAL